MWLFPAAAGAASGPLARPPRWSGGAQAPRRPVVVAGGLDGGLDPAAAAEEARKGRKVQVGGGEPEGVSGGGKGQLGCREVMKIKSLKGDRVWRLKKGENRSVGRAEGKWGRREGRREGQPLSRYGLRTMPG